MKPTRLALVRLRSANLRTFLVTGRELSDFQGMKGFLPIFDVIVAENGAVLYEPGSDTTRSLGAPPPESFIAELARRGVTPGVGISIVATREPFQAIVLEVIKELGLELQVIFNKGAVMARHDGEMRKVPSAKRLQRAKWFAQFWSRLWESSDLYASAAMSSWRIHRDEQCFSDPDTAALCRNRWDT